MRSEFEVAFNEITELRALPRDVVLEALQTALVSAYRRDTSASAAQRVEASIDPKTGRPRIFVEKEVVDSVRSVHTEVTLEKARFFDPSAQYGDVVMVQVEGSTKKYGRIAAQTAKQVILQKIREAERKSLYDEYMDREGDLITGTVQSVNPQMVTLSLGRAEAILPRAQQIPGERYKPHDKVRTYVLEVKNSNRGPQIIVSRSHRNMLRRLLEYEVPEIYNGQVEIKNIAREAGYRSKVAVSALQEGIDPVGACVGMRGMRIQNIVKELHEEKIDVIEWNPDQQAFIAKALSPARVNGVYLEDDVASGRTAVVIVPDDQLSLAIGREGQNARLAAKLTGWRIDIKSVTEAIQDALNKIDTLPLSELSVKHSDLLAEVYRIMEKKAANRTVMPEEYQTLGKFADVVERLLLAEREAEREARMAEINMVKSTLPQGAFELGVEVLDLPEEVVEALQPLGNVGEIMWRFLIDENYLRQMLNNLSNDSFSRLQAALDKVVIPEVTAPPVIEIPEEVASPTETAPAEASVEESGEAELVKDAFADEPVDVTAPAIKEPVPGRIAPAGDSDEDDEDEEDIDALLTDDDGEKGESKKKKKDRQKRRHLIYDEEIGEVVSKRRRKGGRTRDDWDDFLD